MFLINYLWLIITSLADVLTEWIFWLVVGLVALQYRHMALERDSLFGVVTRRAWPDLLTAVAYGIIGGLAGTMLIITVGLSLDGSNLLYLWPIAVLLMLINPRFLCFAYAGGILALSNLILGFPSLNIVQVLALVAVLHMVESVLILVSGHLGAVPAYFRTPGGRVVGGFNLQKLWPIPIAVLSVAGNSISFGSMPGWWPLLRTSFPGGPEYFAYGLIPVVACLGYGDLAISHNPNQKSRLSALYLGIYSIILLFLSYLSQDMRTAAFIAALFSPLGHELVIFFGRRLELKGKPLYVPTERGLRVLDVLVDTPVWRAGVRSGDVILSINGREISSEMPPDQFLTEERYCEVEFLHGQDQVYKRGTAAVRDGQEVLSFIPVPDSFENRYVDLGAKRTFGQFLKKLVRR
ncbi:MAG TPA: PDZ domain-containing protein [Desulfotomaculum sp.]|nr:MAG: PDZ/DHR/GLGF domain protein [Desulfotomaculum sp. 46_80]HAG11786.1 PDZ domain-containing protein [Desulfotomaculum sp.]HBY03826.1 PDZ domain-containing protein [Desulfotomaculum sp.]